MDGLDDVAGREIIGFQEIIRFPRFAEAVLDADEFYWDTAVLGQGFADGPSQTAHDLMFFTDDDGPRFSRTSTDRIQVQRFDRVDVDDAGRNTFPGQFIRRRQGFMDMRPLAKRVTSLPSRKMAAL